MSSRSDIIAGRAFVKVGVQNELPGQLRKALAGAGKALKVFATGAATVTAAGAAGLAAIVKRTAEAGAQFHKLGIQTGTSAREMSQLKFAANQSGVEFDDLVGAVEELNIRLGETIKDGTGPAGAALAALGLDAQKLAEMPVSERLGAIGDELRKIGDNTQRQFLADEIFGGDAFKVLSLIDKGSEGIANLRKESDRLGVTMSDNAAASAAEFNSSVKELTASFDGALNQVGSAILDSEALTDGMSELADAIADIDWKGFAEEGITAFSGIAESVADFTAGIATAFQQAQLGLQELQIQQAGGRDTSIPTTGAGLAQEVLTNIFLPGAGLSRDIRRFGGGTSVGQNLDTYAGSLIDSNEQTEQGHNSFNESINRLRDRFLGSASEREKRREQRKRDRENERQLRELARNDSQLGNPFFGSGGGGNGTSGGIATVGSELVIPSLLEDPQMGGGGFATASAAAAAAMGFGGQKSTDDLLKELVDQGERQTRQLEQFNAGLIHA